MNQLSNISNRKNLPARLNPGMGSRPTIHVHWFSGFI